MQHLFPIIAMIRVDCHPKRKGGVQFHPHVAEFTRSECFTQPLGTFDPLLQRCPRHDDQEFLATITAGDVGTTDLLAEQVAKFLEQVVPGIVPIGVIESFESVNIHHHQANNGTLALGKGKFAFKGFFEVTPVE